jgi:hypothetical protein
MFNVRKEFYVLCVTFYAKKDGSRLKKTFNVLGSMFYVRKTGLSKLKTVLSFK